MHGVIAEGCLCRRARLWRAEALAPAGPSRPTFMGRCINLRRALLTVDTDNSFAVRNLAPEVLD